VEGLALPGPVDPERFLALELEPGALSGATGIVTPRGRLIEAQPATRARQRA
jgi:predicted N-acetyltransferase YhbS